MDGKILGKLILVCGFSCCFIGAIIYNSQPNNSGLPKKIGFSYSKIKQEDN